MDPPEANSSSTSAQKRRLSDTEVALPKPKLFGESSEPKQRKKELSAAAPQLQGFCDEVLYEIFKYLDTSSILAVMNCSDRFENLLLDHRFWHNIDLSNAPLPLGILEEILGRATEKTHTIKICGPPSSQHVAGEFKQFTCTLTTVFPKVATHLQILELEGVSLDFEYIHISEFPASLKRLVFKDCSVKVGDHVKSIFHTIEKQLIVLEDLSIEDNRWFEPFYIMALSKLPALRRLSLKGCQMLSEFVPYGSMAARFGFQQLEILDLRLTPINNSDLQCFGAVKNLKELLLESPPNQEKETPTPSSSSSSSSNGEIELQPVPKKDKPVTHIRDDEPSTSRAALEHFRACQNGLCSNGQPQSAEPSASKPTEAFNSDNCNERKQEAEGSSSSSPNTNQPPSANAASANGSNDEDSSSESDANGRNSPPDAEVAAAARAAAAAVHNPQRSPFVVLTLPDLQRQHAEDMRRAYVVEGAPPDGILAVAHEAGNPAGNAAGNPPGQPEQLEPDVVRMSILDLMAQHLNGRGNNPARSRFLPRPDHVVYMNPNALGREPMVVMHSRRARVAPRGNLDQVVQHPMFWNMLDPLDRNFPRRVRIDRGCTSTFQPVNKVSDRAIYSFGRASNPVQPDVVWIRNVNRSPNNQLERILLRNYHHITNHSLEHLVQCSPNLKYIDVSGTSVTQTGVQKFKNLKPNCEVVATHLTVLEDLEKTSEKQESATAKTEAETEAATESEPCAENNAVEAEAGIENAESKDEPPKSNTPPAQKDP